MNELIKEQLTPNSSFIDKLEYSYFLRHSTCGNNLILRTTERITIWFSNGDIIEYQLTEKDWNELKDCESVGKYFHSKIKLKCIFKVISKGLKL